MTYPTYEFLVELHTYLMHEVWHEDYYGPHRPELLESALARPRQAAAYADADGVLQSAYLFHGLLMNHGFVQGNKRTAYFSSDFRLAAVISEMSIVSNVPLHNWSIESRVRFPGSTAPAVPGCQRASHRREAS